MMQVMLLQQNGKNTKKSQFERLFHQHYSEICRYLTRRVQAHVVEELAGEVFLVAWRRFDDMPVEPLPWLYVVSGNVLANYRRSLSRQQALVDHVKTQTELAGPSVLDVLVGHGLSQQAIAALAKLSNYEREALLLTCVEKLDSKSAAKVMNCSAIAFRARLSRARRKLEAFFAGELVSADGIAIHTACPEGGMPATHGLEIRGK